MKNNYISIFSEKIQAMTDRELRIFCKSIIVLSDVPIDMTVNELAACFVSVANKTLSKTYTKK